MSEELFDISIKDIEKARKVLQQYFQPSPLLRSDKLSIRMGCEVYLKLENFLPIGSFKIRGALYKISQLSDDERKRGIIAASLGNHAQGVAWASKKMKTEALIVMPKEAPHTKIHKTRKLGAQVHLEGNNYNEANRVAKRMAEERGAIYVPAYLDPMVIAGQGTVGLEIMDQLTDADVVIGPVGGGGLMSGVSIAIKSLSKKTKVIACQASGCSSMVDSVKKGIAIKIDQSRTFADGISVPEASSTMLALLQPNVDTFASAEDDEIASALLALMEDAKIVAEGAGALPLAILEKMKDDLAGKKVVLIISGGNIDVNLLARIIDQGLMESGRRLRISVIISDKPGSLYQLTHLIAQQGASVIQAIHDRNEPSTMLDETTVHLTLETRGVEHSKEIIRELEKSLRQVEVRSNPWR